jgi:hypothetical protein
VGEWAVVKVWAAAAEAWAAEAWAVEVEVAVEVGAAGDR